VDVNFSIYFFTPAETSHMMRFVIIFFYWYTVIFPGPVQETVRGAGFEPGTAGSSVFQKFQLLNMIAARIEGLNNPSICLIDTHFSCQCPFKVL
jgi:hypothetical protein